MNQDEITSRVATALGRSIQAPKHGVIVLNSDGSNPAQEAFTIPVKIEEQPETYYARYSPLIDATDLRDGTPVELYINEDGEYEMQVDARRARMAYSVTPVERNLVNWQHSHADANSGGQLNASNIFSAGMVSALYGGTGRATLTANNLLSGNTTGAVNLIAPGASGQYLRSNGTVFSSSALDMGDASAGLLALARGGTNVDTSGLTTGALIAKTATTLSAATLTAGAVMIGGAAGVPGAVAPGSDGDVLTVVAGAWASAAAGGGSSPFTTTGSLVHLVTTTNNLNIGGTTDLGKVAIVGDADETQFLVRPYFLQSGNIMVVEDPAGNAAFAIDAVGGFKVNINQTSTASFQAYGENDSSLFATSPTNDRVGVGITSPDSRFEVRGWADEIQTIIRANGTQTSDIFRITTSAPATLLSVTNAGKLFISGETEIDGALNHDGSTVGFYGTTPLAQQAQTVDLKDAIVALGLMASSGGATPLNLDGGALTVGNTVIGGTFTQDGGAVVFNEAGADQDFRIESDGDANALFVDAGNNRIGIRTASPTDTLHVNGSTSLDGALVVNEAGADVDTRIEGDTDTDLVKIDAGLDMVGISEGTPTALVHIGASTTTRASMRMTTGTAPTSPNDGDVWNSDAQNAMMMYLAGLAGAFGKVIFTQTAVQSVANTGTETTLFGTGIGSRALPANYPTVGKTFLVIMGGNFGALASTGALDIRIKLSTTQLAITTDTVSSASDDTGWFMAALITIYTVGATGTAFAQGIWLTEGGGNHIVKTGTTATTIDTTGALTVEVTADWTPTNNTINTTNAMILELN